MKGTGLIKSDKMNITYIINKTSEFYLIQLKIYLLSLVEHHEKGSLVINLIYENLTADEIKDLKNLTKGHELNLILFPKERYEKELKTFSDIKGSNYNVSVFYRLFLQELLDEDINKILYLDLDTIVNKNLSSFFRHKTKKDIMAAREIVSPDLGYGKTRQYFNAGVFLLNLKSLRDKKKNLLKMSLKEAKKHSYLMFLDQDLLNILFLNNKEIMSPLWVYLMIYPTPYIKPDEIYVFHTFFNAKTNFLNMHKEYVDLNNHYYKLVTGEEYVPKLLFKQKIKRIVYKFLPNAFLNKFRIIKTRKSSKPSIVAKEGKGR